MVALDNLVALVTIVREFVEKSSFSNDCSPFSCLQISEDVVKLTSRDFDFKNFNVSSCIGNFGIINLVLDILAEFASLSL